MSSYVTNKTRGEEVVSLKEFTHKHDRPENYNSMTYTLNHDYNNRENEIDGSTYKSSNVDLMMRPRQKQSLNSIQGSINKPRIKSIAYFKQRPLSSKHAKDTITKSYKTTARYVPKPAMIAKPELKSIATSLKSNNQRRTLRKLANREVSTTEGGKNLISPGDALINFIDSNYQQLEDQDNLRRVQLPRSQDPSVEVLYGREWMKQQEVRSTNSQLDEDIKQFRSNQAKILSQIRMSNEVKPRRIRPSTAKVIAN